jgi:hypothetical protein
VKDDTGDSTHDHYYGGIFFGGGPALAFTLQRPSAADMKQGGGVGSAARTHLNRHRLRVGLYNSSIANRLAVAVEQLTAVLQTVPNLHSRSSPRRFISPLLPHDASKPPSTLLRALCRLALCRLLP